MTDPEWMRLSKFLCKKGRTNHYNETIIIAGKKKTVIPYYDGRNGDVQPNLPQFGETNATHMYVETRPVCRDKMEIEPLSGGAHGRELFPLCAWRDGIWMKSIPGCADDHCNGKTARALGLWSSSYLYEKRNGGSWGSIRLMYCPAKQR